MARWNTWNFFNRNVQSGLTEGQFINMGSCLIAAGPPFLGIGGAVVLDEQGGDQAVGDTVYPLGLGSQWSINQQLAVVPIPEAGSYRRYTITGPADGSFAMGRTLYHGPSALRVLYAYYKAQGNSNIPISPLIDDFTASQMLRNPHNDIQDHPGHENFWANMCSSIFSQPVGILLYIQDVNRESYGAIYLEQYHVGSHGMGTGPGQLVLSEQFAGTFSRVRPVKLANPIPLMSRISNVKADDDSGKITVAGTNRTTGGLQRIETPTGSNV
jgi:hypothetical protein